MHSPGAQAEPETADFIEPAARESWGLRWSKVVLALCAFVILWWLGNGVYYPDDYDDGVYLASARSMASGHSLYSEVFFAQTPLAVALMPLGLKWISSGEIGARSAILFFSLLGLVGTGLIAFRLFGTRGVLLATGLQAIQLSRVGSLWTLQAEVPAMGCALLAIGIALRHSGKLELRMTCAGVLFALAMLCKVWVLPFLVPILLSRLVAADGVQGAGSSWRQWMLSILFAGVAGLLTAVILLSGYDFRSFYAQAIQFHIDARAVYNHAAMRNVRVLSEYFAIFGGMAMLAALGAVLLATTPANRGDLGTANLAFPTLDVGGRNRPVNLWMAGWLGASVLFLVWHTPLFPHHALMLAPIMSLWGCAAVLGLIDRARWSGMKSAVVNPAILVSALVLAMFNAAGPASPFQLIANGARDRAAPRDRAAIDAVQRLATGDEFVGGDDPGLVFRAGRQSPPELCDTSFVRIRSGYLPLTEAVAAASRCKVIVLGTGRLRQLPGFQDWLVARFEPVADVGSRVIYVKRGVEPRR